MENIKCYTNESLQIAMKYDTCRKERTHKEIVDNFVKRNIERRNAYGYIHTQNTINVSKCITLSRWTRNIWDHDAFFINKIRCTKNDATSHSQPKCNWMWHEIKSKKMPVFYLVCSFNGSSCEMCYWNAPFECRFKWNHSNRFSSSTVINGNQHWQCQSGISMDVFIISKRFSIQNFSFWHFALLFYRT